MDDFTERENFVYQYEKIDDFTHSFYIDIDASQKGDKIRLYKTYKFQKDSYMFDVEIKLVNLENKEVKLWADNSEYRSFYIYWGEGFGPFQPEVKKQPAYDNWRLSYLGGDGKGNFVDKIGEKKEAKDTIETAENIKWIGLDNRYFFVSLIPDTGDKIFDAGVVIDPYQRQRANRQLFGLAYKNVILEANAERTISLSTYVGPKQRNTLNKYNTTASGATRDFNEINERAWDPIVWIAIGFDWLIFRINDIFKNFGLSIVIFSIIFKIIFFPLTMKSLSSGKRMQKVQPKVQEIKKKYKDPQQQQKAIMELYKKEKVNPLGGCLPLLIQLPFFFALWQVLPYIAELTTTKFLWIKDLSSPDTIFDLGFIEFNLLPLIMVGLMIVSMQLTPMTPNPQTGKSQGKLLKWIMPLILLFVFYRMPSGMVLYFAVSNLLQIGQQQFVNRWKSDKDDKNGAVPNLQKR